MLFLNERIHFYLSCCIFVCVASQGNHETFQTYSPDLSITLTNCGSEIIVPVESYLLVTDPDDNFRPTGQECDTSQIFRDMCEAEIRCEITIDDFNSRVENSCPTDERTGIVNLVFTCLSISNTKNIGDTNDNFDGVVYLRSSNYRQNNEISDVKAMCVIDPVSQPTFRLIKLEAVLFLNTVESGTPELNVLATPQIYNEDYSIDDSTKQFINYTSFIGVELQSLNITYEQTPQDLEFLMTINVTSTVRICCSMYNDTYDWQHCEPVTSPIPSVTDRSKKGSSSAGMDWIIPLIIAPVVLACVVLVVIVLGMIYRTRIKSNNNSSLCPAFCPQSCTYKKASTGEGNDSPREQVQLDNRDPCPDVIPKNNYRTQQSRESSNTPPLDYGLSPYSDIGETQQYNETKPIPKARPRTKPPPQPRTDVTAVYAVPDKLKKPQGEPPAPNKPPRLNQGIVEEQKSKLIGKLDMSRDSQPENKRTSETKWANNDIYGQC